MRPRTHLHQNGWPGQDQSVVSRSQHYSSVTQQYNGNNISLPRSVAQRAIRGPLEGTKEIFCHPSHPGQRVIIIIVRLLGIARWSLNPRISLAVVF